MNSNKCVGMDVHTATISVAVRDAAGKLARAYLTISKDLTRVMNRVKAIDRSWGIPCAGKNVYNPRHREEWLSKITQASVRRRAELYYEQLDALIRLRKQARQELLAESKKHQVWKLLRSIPALMAIVQTPHRFRNKRLWRWTFSPSQHSRLVFCTAFSSSATTGVRSCVAM